MGAETKIEWTDATWNPITGCSVISPGCTNCYAMRLAGGRLRNHPSRAGLTDDTKAGPVWNGGVHFNNDWIDQPLRWRKARRIFVCAHGDLFHENVPDEWIARVFTMMASTPRHTFQVLTKRADRMRRFVSGCANGHGLGWMTHNGRAPKGYGEDGIVVGTAKAWPLPNVWLGTSIEDRPRGEQRAWDLANTPAALRFWSVEPLLADLGDLTGLCLRDTAADGRPAVGWVIVGGESGPNARPMHPDWARSLRDQCSDAGVPFFFKQWGEYRPCTDAELRTACGAIRVGEVSYMRRVGKARAGRLLDGVEHNEFPRSQS